MTLIPVGTSIVSPMNDDERRTGLRQALLNPELFHKIYTYYDNKQIPREELFKSTLKREFKLKVSHANACYTVVMKNMTDYDLIQAGHLKTL